MILPRREYAIIGCAHRWLNAADALIRLRPGPEQTADSYDDSGQEDQAQHAECYGQFGCGHAESAIGYERLHFGIFVNCRLEREK